MDPLAFGGDPDLMTQLLEWYRAISVVALFIGLILAGHTVNLIRQLRNERRRK